MLKHFVLRVSAPGFTRWTRYKLKSVKRGGNLHRRLTNEAKPYTKCKCKETSLQQKKSPPGTEPEPRCNTPGKRKRGGCHLAGVIGHTCLEQRARERGGPQTVAESLFKRGELKVHPQHERLGAAGTSHYTLSIHNSFFI